MEKEFGELIEKYKESKESAKTKILKEITESNKIKLLIDNLNTQEFFELVRIHPNKEKICDLIIEEMKGKKYFFYNTTAEIINEFMNNLSSNATKLLNGPKKNKSIEGKINEIELSLYEQLKKFLSEKNLGSKMEELDKNKEGTRESDRGTKCRKTSDWYEMYNKIRKDYYDNFDQEKSNKTFNEYLSNKLEREYRNLLEKDIRLVRLFAKLDAKNEVDVDKSKYLERTLLELKEVPKFKCEKNGEELNLGTIYIAEYDTYDNKTKTYFKETEYYQRQITGEYAKIGENNYKDKEKNQEEYYKNKYSQEVEAIQKRLASKVVNGEPVESKNKIVSSSEAMWIENMIKEDRDILFILDKGGEKVLVAENRQNSSGDKITQREIQSNFLKRKINQDISITHEINDIVEITDELILRNIEQDIGKNENCLTGEMYVISSGEQSYKILYKDINGKYQEYQTNKLFKENYKIPNTLDEKHTIAEFDINNNKLLLLYRNNKNCIKGVEVYDGYAEGMGKNTRKVDMYNVSNNNLEINHNSKEDTNKNVKRRPISR